MKLKWVKKVYADGNHNGFTGLAFFKGRYYLAFRNGRGHEDSQARQIIMASDDGEKWKVRQNALMPGAAGTTVDYRDSYFLSASDSLRLYSCATPV